MGWLLLSSSNIESNSSVKSANMLPMSFNTSLVPRLMLVLVLLVVGTRRPSDGDSTAATDEDEYVKAASAG